MISVVIPTLNAEAHLAACLDSVADCEVIVADGGSRDRTREISTAAGATWVEAPRGRARQMNAGAAHATGTVLVFLHADTVLAPGWQAEVLRAVADPAFRIGAFRLRFDHAGLAFRLIEIGVRFRCRFGQGPYGDQALFLRRADFPGFPDLPIMEDFELVRQLGPARLLDVAAITSAERFSREGVWRRVRRNRAARRQHRAGAPGSEVLSTYLNERRRVCMFCKQPAPGKVKTRLAAGLGEQGAERATEIYRRLVEYTFSQVHASSAEARVCFDPPEAREHMEAWLQPATHRPQCAGDLGARMLDAFDGTTSTLVIGTDCPGLSTATLEQAFRELQSADVVIGPTHDGGYYLIGAREALPTLFDDMPWSTPEVLGLTLTRAAAAGLRVVTLPTLGDLDTVDDLHVLRDVLLPLGLATPFEDA